MCQRVERPLRYGGDGVRQHAHAARRQHQDDREGAGCRHPPHHAWVQGKIQGNSLKSIETL